MMRLKLICKSSFVFLISILLWHSAAADDAFDNFSNRQDSLFNSFSSNMDLKYDEFVARQDSLYNAFVIKVDRMWDDHVYPSKKDYVEYKKDYSARIHVDFEKGKVEASVLIEIEADDVKLNDAKLTVLKELTTSITTSGSNDLYQTNNDAEQSTHTEIVSLTDKEEGIRKLIDNKDSGQIEKIKVPILINQVAEITGEEVKSENAREFIEETVGVNNIVIDTVVGTDGLRRIKLSGNYKLVPDHIKKRAARYFDLVLTYADKYQLDPRLVLAIMHTESYFNPVATSRIPAFGLMQIVPGSAGRDAYKFVYGKDKLLKKEYLYNPANNIELGCAYLNIVRFKYLKEIQDDQLAYPCAIASYNGGIGTLARALTGTKKLNRIAGAVQGENFDGIVKKLNRVLPYKETKDYLNRVLERMSLYDEWVE